VAPLSFGEGAPGVLCELVERLLLERGGHSASLPDNQQRQLRWKLGLFGRKVTTVNHGHGSILEVGGFGQVRQWGHAHGALQMLSVCHEQLPIILAVHRPEQNDGIPLRSEQLKCEPIIVTYSCVAAAKGDLSVLKLVSWIL